MKKGLFISLCTIIFFSCNKNESNENLAQLKEKFHGKYEMISSTSSNAVDLNMDGISSTYLLDENSEIARAELELRIYSNNNFLFEEKWPVEYISNSSGEIVDSTYTINYALYCNIESFQFTDDYKSLQLQGSLNQASVNTLKSIESIVVEENEIIKVTTIRKLYTKKGWITTKIESRYKRYTTAT